MITLLHLPLVKSLNMSIQIQVLENEAHEIISLFESKEIAIKSDVQRKQDELNASLLELERVSRQLKTLRASIAQKSPDSINGKTNIKLPFDDEGAKEDILNGYPLTGTWWNKIEYILKKEADYMPTSKILQTVFEYEPRVSKDVAMKSVTGVLSTRSKPGGFLEIERRNKRFVYKLKNLL